MFREAHRILKFGGGFRVTAPDAVLDYHALKKNDVSFFSWYADQGADAFQYPPQTASIGQLFLAHLASQKSSFGNPP